VSVLKHSTIYKALYDLVNTKYYLTYLVKRNAHIQITRLISFVLNHVLLLLGLPDYTKYLKKGKVYRDGIK
jgi:hypothetical protein